MLAAASASGAELTTKARAAWSYKGSAMCCMDLDLPQAEVEQRMASGIQDSKTQAAFPHS